MRRRNRCRRVVKAFDPDEILNLTTYLAVVDKDHNMVSMTSSLLSGFGSGVVVDKGGFFMNDRMRYFYLDPKDVNSLQPGKRVRQTINPAMALKDGKPWIAFGTPGPTRSRRRSCSSSSTSPSSG